jgi:hypothetical protein
VNHPNLDFWKDMSAFSHYQLQQKDYYHLYPKELNLYWARN